MITEEMTIEEIFDTFPDKAQRIAQELMNAGLECVGCQAATYETLEMGMLSHGYAQKEIISLLSKLNAILEEEIDATTITITPKAGKKYLEILKAEGKEGWGLRLADKAGGCSGFEYLLDYSEKALDDDEVFHSEGIEIHIKKSLLDRMLGSQIDYVDGLQGAGFKITNPNVKSSCSCGKSQSY